MATKIYLAMLEPGDDGFSVSFPDLPGCVSFGEDTETAIRNATEAASFHLEGMAEDGEAAPEPGHHGDQMMAQASTVGANHPVIWAYISVEAPDAAERVNVYMSKSLLQRLDNRADGMGLTRSAFIAMATREKLAAPRAPAPALTAEQFEEAMRRSLANIELAQAREGAATFEERGFQTEVRTGIAPRKG